MGQTEAGRFALIDELGLVRLVGAGLDTVDLRWIDAHLEETPVTPAALPEPTTDSAKALLRAIQKRPRRAELRLRLATLLEATDAEAAREQVALAHAANPKSAPVAVRLARMLLDASERPKALRVLDDARRLNPGAMWLRRQYWALDEPNRFYGGSIDLAWQREQRKVEDAAWGRLRRR